MDRKTKVSNQILKRLLVRYDLVHIRIFLAVLNKAISKSYSMMKNNYITEDDINEYGAEDINITMADIKKMHSKKNLTKKEIENFMENMASIKLTYNDKIGVKNIIRTVLPFSSIEYCEEEQQFTFSLNEKEIELLILIKDKYTILDLNDVMALKSKYEFAVYVWFNMYKTFKTIELDMQEIKEFLNSSGSNNDILKYIRKAIDNINIKLNYNIQYSEKKIGRLIKSIRLKW